MITNTARKPRSHELKTDPAVFEAVVSFYKTYEIRKNDRDFAVGDELVLRETVHTGEHMALGAPLQFTGRTATRTVSHVLAGYGLQEGWCILSFASCMPVSMDPLEYALPEPVMYAEAGDDHPDIYDAHQVTAAFAAGRAAERAHASAFDIEGVARWRDRYALLAKAPNDLVDERRKGACRDAEIADLRAILLARLPRAGTAPSVKAVTRDWVDCPICGESDMRREADADGHALIFCVNHACVSNGGTNDVARVPAPVAAQVPTPVRVVAWRRATKHNWEYRNTAPTASTSGAGWLPLFDGPVGIAFPSRSLRQAMRAEQRVIFDLWLAREYPVSGGVHEMYGKSMLELMLSAWSGGAACTVDVRRDAKRYGAVRARAYAFGVGNPTPEQLDADVDAHLAASNSAEGFAQ